MAEPTHVTFACAHPYRKQFLTVHGWWCRVVVSRLQSHSAVEPLVTPDARRDAREIVAGCTHLRFHKSPTQDRAVDGCWRSDNAQRTGKCDVADHWFNPGSCEACITTALAAARRETDEQWIGGFNEDEHPKWTALKLRVESAEAALAAARREERDPVDRCALTTAGQPAATAGDVRSTAGREHASKIVQRIMPCSCHEGFTSRRLSDPSCAYCDVGEDLVDAIDGALAEEREACARIAESAEPEVWPYGLDTGHMWRLQQGKNIAAAIRKRRSRSEPEPSGDAP